MTALAGSNPIAGLIEFFAEHGNGLRFLNQPRVCGCRHESEPCSVCANLARIAHVAVDATWLVLPSGRRAHLIRGNGVTLCGSRHASPFQWQPAPDGMRRCQHCELATPPALEEAC